MPFFVFADTEPRICRLETIRMMSVQHLFQAVRSSWPAASCSRCKNSQVGGIYGLTRGPGLCTAQQPQWLVLATSHTCFWGDSLSSHSVWTSFQSPVSLPSKQARTRAPGVIRNETPRRYLLINWKNNSNAKVSLPQIQGTNIGHWQLHALGCKEHIPDLSSGSCHSGHSCALLPIPDLFLKSTSLPDYNVNFYSVMYTLIHSALCYKQIKNNLG